MTLLQGAELAKTDLFVDVGEPLRPSSAGSEVLGDLPVPRVAVGVQQPVEQCLPFIGGKLTDGRLDLVEGTHGSLSG